MMSHVDSPFGLSAIVRLVTEALQGLGLRDRSGDQYAEGHAHGQLSQFDDFLLLGFFRESFRLFADGSTKAP